jgi:hypothetical protein
MDEKIIGFIDRAYKCASNHGFHDKKLSDAHMLMLVVSEISEMVEADRKCRHADIESYEDEIRYGADVYDKNTRSPFEKYIKDTVEDELADVFIRIFDYCGALGVMPDGIVDMKEEFLSLFGKDDFSEQCFVMTGLVLDIEKEDDVDLKIRAIGSFLSFCIEFAAFHHINWEWHVTHKMHYNEHRPRKHGKKY